MLFSNPVPGTIHVSAYYYKDAPGAWVRPSGNTDFVVTHDFGPSDLSVEPTVAFVQDGDEYDIYGHLIPTGTYPDFHVGLDLANGRGGDPVLAAAPGTVEGVGVDASGARYIILNHGTVNGHVFRTQYWHEGSTSVAKGATVVNQQKIGTVGNSGAAGGTSTGFHLHFGVTIDGKPVDPWRRLRQNGYPDPDLPKPLPEAEMIPTRNLLNYTCTVAKGYTIRKAPTTSGEMIRVLAAPETWTLLAVVKGSIPAGATSPDWYVRLAGLVFEFVYSGAVSGLTPPPVSITAAQLEAAKVAADKAGRQAQYDIDAAHIVVTDPAPAPATARLSNARP